MRTAIRPPAARAHRQLFALLALASLVVLPLPRAMSAEPRGSVSFDYPMKPPERLSVSLQARLAELQKLPLPDTLWMIGGPTMSQHICYAGGLPDRRHEWVLSDLDSLTAKLNRDGATGINLPAHQSLKVLDVHNLNGERVLEATTCFGGLPIFYNGPRPLAFSAALLGGGDGFIYYFIDAAGYVDRTEGNPRPIEGSPEITLRLRSSEALALAEAAGSVSSAGQDVHVEPILYVQWRMSASDAIDARNPATPAWRVRAGDRTTIVRDADGAILCVRTVERSGAGG